MDFDIIDDVKPRFQLQSGPLESDVEEKELNKVLIGVCSSVGVVFLALSWFLTGILQFLSFWLALSLVAGPFAPAALTGGNCRVGAGELLPDPEPVEEVLAEPEKRTKGHNRRSDATSGRVPSKESLMSSPAVVSKDDANGTANSVVAQQSKSGAEKEWTGEEIELLRKQLMKFPRGTLQRWDVVAEVFAGSHSTEDVIRMSKLLGEKKFTDGDSYAKFLAQRKGGDKVIDSPLSQRWEGDQGDASNGTKSDWTETEDKSLVSALKTFPKDTPKRWDKVAEAVPGRSKAQCFKRFSELRDSFRSSKVDQALE
ncbi:hypothetical protein KC19_3G151700 [Ceratodon purpureus]|uniref:Uncharacterized protein n=1 Tax=Ceratodon purpureus TaxID=3225 RepID=A0A8T0IL73_CERPU|nr:hypothetical protein KC19_3G151700 [Ceratodon purpureus]